MNFLRDKRKEVVFGTERTGDKGEGATENENRIINQVVVNQVVLVELDGAIDAQIEEAGNDKDQQRVIPRDERKNEGSEKDEGNVGEEEPPLAVVGGIPCGDVADECGKATWIHFRTQPAGKGDENGADDPEVQIEQ